MSAIDPTREVGSSEGIPAEGAAIAATVGGGEASSRWIWIAALLAALAAGLVAWLVGELGVFHSEPAREQVSMMGVQNVATSPRTRAIAELREMSGIFGTFGTLLGAGLGLTGSLTGRFRRRAWIACAVGAVAGGSAGLVMPWAVIPAYNRAETYGGGDLSGSLVMHLGLWGPPCAAAAMALGIGRSASWSRGAAIALLGGAIGTAIGILLYDVLGALLFPLAETGRPISQTWITRLMALLLVALSTAAGAVAATSSGGPSKASRPVAPTPPS